MPFAFCNSTSIGVMKVLVEIHLVRTAVVTCVRPTRDVPLIVASSADTDRASRIHLPLSELNYRRTHDIARSAHVVELVPQVMLSGCDGLPLSELPL
jgi:hypothetical protein